MIKIYEQIKVKPRMLRWNYFIENMIDGERGRKGIRRAELIGTI